MSPSAEQEILRKLETLTTVLLGFDGQENTGFINRTEEALNEHEARIGSIEKWMWRCVGAGLLATAFIEFWRR